MTVKDLLSSAMCDVYIHICFWEEQDPNRTVPAVCVKQECEGMADGILSDTLLNRQVGLIGIEDGAMHIDLLEDEGDG